MLFEPRKFPEHDPTVRTVTMEQRHATCRGTSWTCIDRYLFDKLMPIVFGNLSKGYLGISHHVTCIVIDAHVLHGYDTLSTVL